MAFSLIPRGVYPSVSALDPDALEDALDAMGLLLG